jgi:hypothetical protein
MVVNYPKCLPRIVTNKRSQNVAHISSVDLNIEELPGGSQYEVTVKYSLHGDAFDIASLQPYEETCKLVGNDRVFGEDNNDDNIVGGELTPLLINPNVPNSPGRVVFFDVAPIQRVFTKAFPRIHLNEDVGPDELTAVVTLTPIPPKEVKRESNMEVLNL